MQDDISEDYGQNSYKLMNLENDIIKYICEKIVAMREEPFIDAVNNLRKDQELKNLEMIMEIQKNKSKWNQSAQASQPSGINLHKQLY
jgi:hypothetical protein